MDRQTDGRIAAVLTNCRLQVGSSREPMKGVAFVFGTCLSGPEEHSKKEGEDKNTLFCPHCVQSAERDVEYQNDPKVEEVLSHQHSILVLHDPLQVDYTSLI